MINWRFGNVEFKFIVMCNLYSIFSRRNIHKSCNFKLCCSLSDRADFCTVYHLLDYILIDKMSQLLKFFDNSACRPVALIYQMQFCDLNDSSKFF